jgi:energy-coupling factor transporter ATP-binding protein EcfA2
MKDVTTDILEWTAKLKPWQQDAIRRLAATDQLTPEDEEELLVMLKYEHGIAAESGPPAPVPLTAEHLSSPAGLDIVRITAISQVRNANRLADDQRLEFELNGLTAVYGANGSGKSGYTRILRNACRSRISSVDGKHKPILADVYGGAAAPASASLHLNVAGSDVVVPWTDGTQSDGLLARIAVFDSDAAALYVDEGSHIAFLPFNLDLLFRLNDVCTRLRKKLDAEMKELKDVLGAVTTDFPPTTEAGRFLAGLSASTTAEAIEVATAWTDADAERLRELTTFLSGQDQREAADLHALVIWAARMAERIATAEELLGEHTSQTLQILQAEAVASRTTADSASESAFRGDCLPGVGSDTWRRLYAAAREYSLQAAYPGRDFPVVDDGARCVLCHQGLAPPAAERLRRFDSFVTGELARQASRAEDEFRKGRDEISAVIVSAPSEDAQYLERLREHDDGLASRLTAWITAADARRAGMLASCEDAGRWPTLDAPPDATTGNAVTELADRLKAEIAAREAARHGEERLRLEAARRDLEARQRLSPLRPLIEQRVRDFELHAALTQCVDATSTGSITRKAGELSAAHLTPRVQALFDDEVAALRLQHLRPAIARRPDKRGAQYKTDLAPILKCRSSDILSEGEHRALALASFLAEAKAVSDNATIVVDDPISSLDHDRSTRVAHRLAQEAQRRQVIIFTHSLVFLHHLVVAAEKLSVDLECKAVYRSGTRAGLRDPGGEPWQGKNLRRRLGVMDNLLAQVKRAEKEPPEQYGMAVRSFYGRLRDCWERLVEEKVFAGVLMRFDQDIKTQNLRYVNLTDELQRRIEAGMDRSSTYNHDNPASETDPMPAASEAEADLRELRDVLALVEATNKATAARRESPVVAALVASTSAASVSS